MRFSTHVVLGIVIANALIGAAGTAGMWDDWGIEPNAGVSESQLDSTKEAFQDVTVGGLGASTLINLFVFGSELLQSGLQLVTALPSFLENIGVPTFIAMIPNVAVIILFGRDILQILMGRGI